MKLSRRKLMIGTGAVAAASILPMPALAKVTRETSFIKFTKKFTVNSITGSQDFIPNRITYVISNWMEEDRTNVYAAHAPRQSGKSTNGILWSIYTDGLTGIRGVGNVHGYEIIKRADRICFLSDRTEDYTQYRFAQNDRNGLEPLEYGYNDEWLWWQFGELPFYGSKKTLLLSTIKYTSMNNYDDPYYGEHKRII